MVLLFYMVLLRDDYNSLTSDIFQIILAKISDYLYNIFVM